MNNFADRLRYAIEVSGNTQATIASQVGVERSTINNLIAGRKNPSNQLLRSLSLALSVREEWLLEGKGAMEAHHVDVLDDFESDVISELRLLPKSQKRITAKMLIEIIKRSK